MTGRGSIGLAAALAVLVAGPGAAGCELDGGASRNVAQVASGDRLVLDDGEEAILIGALPPSAALAEAAGGAAWPPEAASRRELETLVAGRPVEIASAGRRIDRYGRHLVHVFVQRDGERVWVQGHMIERGFARAYGLPGHVACLGELLARERVAREGRLGHWGSGVFVDRDATDLRALAGYRDTFQTLEGRVEQTGKVRGQTVIAFAPAGRTGFTAVMDVDGGAKRGRRDGALPDVAGQRVRVRGWIDVQRRQPFVTIYDRAMIEILGETDAGGPGTGQGGGPVTPAAPLEAGAPIPAAAAQAR